MLGDTPTATGCTFGVFDCGTLGFGLGVFEGVDVPDEDGVPPDEPGPDEVDDVLLEPPPPQAARAAHATRTRA
nr:hypothetical protein [Paraburkholderia susongensis]